ncbi:hypothetical protein [Acrocarpospora catenulata]|uniref:hypothetical protein n=1 Tax=Acrocarpospora catenulata TaxID=2836182 RepID=UPI001BDB2E7A|nr:hypothetical protein [Acrocarpospora catenulata]
MPTLSATTARIASWVGLIAHLCTLPFYSASGLMAPAWAIVVLLVIWAALLTVALWAVRERSAWGLAVPVVSIALWFGAMSAGEAFLGWQA